MPYDTLSHAAARHGVELRPRDPALIREGLHSLRELLSGDQLPFHGPLHHVDVPLMGLLPLIERPIKSPRGPTQAKGR